MKTVRKLHAVQWAALALIPVLFVILIIRSCAPVAQQEKLTIINQGERAAGTIVSKEDFIGYEQGRESTVKYTFTTAAGQEASGEYLLPRSEANELKTGGQLEIAYDPADPSRNLPVIGKEKESELKDRTWLGIGLVSVILCGVAVFLGYVAWETWRLRFKTK